MRRLAKVVLVGVVIVAVSFFFFAPVVLSLTLDGGPVGALVSMPVYVSLSCKAFGVGDIYSPFLGVAFGCNIPSSWPIPI